MDERGDQQDARYGVDIRPARWHIETNDLAQIPPSLNGHTGRVTVMDRASQSVAFDGSADEVRSAIIRLTASLRARTNGAAHNSRPRSESVSPAALPLGARKSTQNGHAPSGTPDYMKWFSIGKTLNGTPRRERKEVSATAAVPAPNVDVASKPAPSINYRVVPFAPGQAAPAQELSYLHREILPTSPAVLLGPHFLESFYYTILPRKGYIQGAVAYVDDVPAGFLVFTLDSDGFMGRAAAHHALRLASTLTKDMLTNPGSLKNIFESWKLMRSRTSSGEPVAEVMSVGVQPFCRGRDFKTKFGIHVARSLHSDAFNRFRRLAVKQIRTIVDESNERSIQYHLSTGWKIFASGIPGWSVPSIELRIRPEDFCAQ